MFAIFQADDVIECDQPRNTNPATCTQYTTLVCVTTVGALVSIWSSGGLAGACGYKKTGRLSMEQRLNDCYYYYNGTYRDSHP
jgi:hypothetical protein